MRITTRRFLRDIIAEVLGLPNSKVIWSNQDGAKQAAPFVTLAAYSHKAEAMEEIRPTGTPGVVDLRTPTAFVLEVRYFGKVKSYPVDILDDLARCMAKPTVVDKCFVNGVAFLYADPVQDITTTLGNDQQFEPAAAIDFHCRFTSSILDEPGYIDTVDIHSDDGLGPGDAGGWLIYGNITKDGKVSDLDHAVPVNVFVNTNN